MTKINKTTIVTLLATAVLGTSTITTNFNTTASAAKTEKVSHHKLTKREKARKAAKAKAAAKKKKALAKQKAEQKKIDAGWKKANAAADKRAMGTTKQTHNTADKVVDGFDTVTNQVVDQNAYVSAIQSKLLVAINNLRAQQGANPVSVGNLDQVAMTRAQQDKEYRENSNTPWYNGHYDQNGQIFVDELAVQQGLYPSYSDATQNISENSGLEDLDTPDVVVNNNMVDTTTEAPNGGHYLNMINPNKTKVNIGVAIDNNGQNVYIIEDYSK